MVPIYESRTVPTWDPFGILLGSIGDCNIGRVLHRVAKLGPFLRCTAVKQSINQPIMHAMNYSGGSTWSFAFVT